LPAVAERSARACVGSSRSTWGLARPLGHPPSESGASRGRLRRGGGTLRPNPPRELRDHVEPVQRSPGTYQPNAVRRSVQGVEWGHIGATIGGETTGIKGKRRDTKPQVEGPFAPIAPGGERASNGLENRKSRKGLPGSNPGPPANYLRFRGPSGRPWGRIGATTGRNWWFARPSARSVSVARRHELEAGGPAVEDATVRRDRSQTACAWLVGIRGRQRAALLDHPQACG
jgi:hypothetical protein